MTDTTNITDATATDGSTNARPTLEQLLTQAGPPPANMTLAYIDFSGPLHSEYGSPPCYAATIDNAFTATECAALVAWAQSQGRAWAPALISGADGEQVLAEDVRNCARIMADDRAVAAWLLGRVRPLLEEDVGVVKGGRFLDPGARWRRVVGMTQWQEGRWRMTRLNERLRFLKYGPGEYFEPHYDGQYCTPDDRERSFVTFQLYLSPPDPGRLGGCTTFWDRFQNFIDVAPKQGRVLVFQHKEMLHSGEEMESGEKITVRTDFMYERIPEEEWEGKGEGKGKEV